MEMHAPNFADLGFHFDNSYLSLPPVFYQKQSPAQVQAPNIVLLNTALAEALGLDAEQIAQHGAAFLSGNSLFPGTEPIAQAYAGHQFGGFNMLGDGRALLLGEHLTPQGQRVDIQLKGSGRTPYSRSGDGRAALGPMLREYIISEAMAALGIPTTRSLAVTSTGETVYRDAGYPGAVLTRVAASHIRVGTFQFAAAIQQPQHLQALADYVIQRHFPDLTSQANRYLALLERVMDLQAKLIAQWMNVGFIHGVMNTDNMSICGETIDYGPCAFMNAYDPETVFSSIDTNGRYAFGNQPNIAHWNLIRLAEALLPLIDPAEDQAIELVTASLQTFPSQFFAAWLSGMRKKLGLFNEEEIDQALAEALLKVMQQNNADFTNTFRLLGGNDLHDTALGQDATFQQWLAQWHARLSRQAQPLADSLQLMQNANPQVIPRNHLVEEALDAALNQADMAPCHALLAALAAPYSDTERATKYLQAPEPKVDQQYRTFCGT
jgi:uncharacterized protein YdiU (UPF0061 family)